MTMSRVGQKGQVVLPKELRDVIGILPGDRVVFDIQDGKIVLTPVPTRTTSDLLGILRMPKSMYVKEARQDYQNHLIDKLKEGQPDA
ncbi:MAG: AbrB/MazE/SpoVT family DNA-binding domain-containing protein [Firmicutes bacterium]|uniref:AbrB family transcriptional regulator n=1 Tax=Sulfobacillus benefaciens TaxID=453960 RepID=A0A2T2X1L5_9FIRM|nr:AbrB/MazE/SpoVT family DNA-binding domain-containing protein [Bacillota bacterium]MCL5013893.1 AbrB/MazE/SpoVT family DNA-binding domain-containing protein [Bacillota bacterium]PSR28362.1 MAG: AbrB family transcriptional regulator [Sulfobacillus benefaciens]HBQ94463.1 AbrB family transcriptional regulator [Sulfobacillus sp.]